MKTPAERAAEWEKKRRRAYMKGYREKNRDNIREKRRASYRKKKEGGASGGQSKGL